MPTQKMGKSLPKRCSNTHAKDYRKSRWAAGQTRKDRRRKEDEARHKDNLVLIAAGLTTPGGRSSFPRKRLKAADKDKVTWAGETQRLIDTGRKPWERKGN